MALQRVGPSGMFNGYAKIREISLIINLSIFNHQVRGVFQVEPRFKTNFS